MAKAVIKSIMDIALKRVTEKGKSTKNNKERNPRP